MDFSTWTFWLIMLPSVASILVLNRLIKSDYYRTIFDKCMLLILSLSLLYFAGLTTLLIFLTVTIIAYITCYTAKKTDRRIKRLILCILIPVLLLPLAYYKYAAFISKDILGQEWDTFHNLIVPIGISFYTFQTLAFCLDTLRNNQEVPSFIDYMNFCSFFPQIVAGPIERRDNLLPQMQRIRLHLNSINLQQGYPYIILGLFFKMVMADNIAIGILNNYLGTNAIQIWINNICFGFRIYFDFAGYGLTAYGIAKCLGVDITMNFQSPYTCSNISDFWRNWHISLTQWFRDYIYFSMKGSRTRFWWFNIIFMFLISGIWHGAGWNFIIWGALGGITMVIHRLFRKRHFQLPNFAGWLLTFSTMMFIWMFFYETNMKIVWKNVKTIFTPEQYNLNEYLQIVISIPQKNAHMITFLPLCMLIIGIEYISQKKYKNPYKIFHNPVVCMIMIIALFMLHTQSHSQFIYFAF